MGQATHAALIARSGSRTATHAAVAAVAAGLRELTPRVLAFLTFLSGVILLFSGATPAIPGRLTVLDKILPLGVIESSHFAASIAGTLLLILSQGLSRRLDAAFYLTAGAMVTGMAASLLKGFDYEEAAILGFVLVRLWFARRQFTRRAALFEVEWSPAWIAALVGAVGSSIWLGLFAFRHVAYSNELWWQFTVNGDASRFLRASVGASVVVLVFGFSRLVHRVRHRAVEPSDADLAEATRAIGAQATTAANLVYLRDKTLLFNDERSAFVMYGVRGRTWVALGDPVGPPEATARMVRLFLERCGEFDGTPVFYEVRKDQLHHYADFGFAFVKLGEEARVDLEAFTLDSSDSARYRKAIRRLDKDGATFRVLASAEVPPVLDQLRRVSDDWLSHKAAAEKGFSLGFFDDEYLGRFPVAVVERDGAIQAFANIWADPLKREISLDLMRYHAQAPKEVMEAMMAHLLVWAKAEGFQWFALGMAPLSGFERSPVSPLWSRLGAFAYEHSGSIYNFQGLRAYKEKFKPVWEPRYLAYRASPTSLRLPRILADVSALVAGGYVRILRK